MVMQEEERPIIFVGHSFGGIIIAQVSDDYLEVLFEMLIKNVSSYRAY